MCPSLLLHIRKKILAFIFKVSVAMAATNSVCNEAVQRSLGAVDGINKPLTGSLASSLNLINYAEEEVR